MATPLLAVKNLRVTFTGVDGELVHAVRDVSFELQRNETMALVGESGSGKSVTSQSIVKLLPSHVTRYGEHSQILFDETDLLQTSTEDLRRIRGRRIAFIFQEPMTSLNPYMKISRQLIEAMIKHQKDIGKKQALHAAIEMLSLSGIRHAHRRIHAYPHEFSGGQLQRIMIAMALLNKPDILVADEPTTALDVTTQNEILNLIFELSQKMGMAVLLITHDLALAEHHADRVCVMKSGTIVETGDIDKIFAEPAHPYTIELLNATPKALKVPTGLDDKQLLEAKHINVRFPMNFNFFGRPKSYFQAVKDISLSIKTGETFGVVGESGSGKSTLGRAILQLLAHSGEVSFYREGKAGQVLEKHYPNSLKADLQIVFQDPFGSLSPRMTIGEIIAEGLQVHQPALSKNQILQRVTDMLTEVDLDAAMINRYPHELSGGQRQRVAIARVVIFRPKFIVLDEPTSALDRSVQIKIVELLLKLQKTYQLSYLMISHDLAIVRAMADRVAIMQKGELVEVGPTQQIFQSPKSDYCKTLIAAALNLGGKST